MDGNEKNMAQGLPERFLERMRELISGEYRAFIESYEKPRTYGLRFNPLKGDLHEGVSRYKAVFGLEPISWCADGFYYDAVLRPGRHPCHEAGVYYIQEPSAMAAVPFLEIKPGERVLDLCAAPGGKTAQIAAALRGQGILVSNDPSSARARVLSQNVERMGAANAVVTCENPQKLKEYFPCFFDKILVDAPCSGEGMFRREEETRAQWSEENIRRCAIRQQEILAAAADMLKEGGKLLYSTCTYAPEEDEGTVAEFLDLHSEFHVVECKKTQGICEGREWAWLSERYSREVLSQLKYTFRIWPHLQRGEGHFWALLSKGEDTANAPCRAKEKKKSQPRFWRDRDGIKLAMDCLSDICLEDALPASCLPDFSSQEMAKRLLLFGNQVYLPPKGLPSLDGLSAIRPGLHLGTLKKRRMEPSHALALSLRQNLVRESLNLPSDSKEVRAYLAGNPLAVSLSRRGWILVCVDGYSLGWGKAVSGILKNHYPRGIRI